ncbi:MAG: CCA tRNA nucleotidyltransferase, partial [Pseudomonadota bacterium]|nr:CCA tRNA nucleotidyltransferase [Pseudomonadota bacterium]
MIRPIDRLAPPAWLTAPASVAIFDALAAAGGTARFVGGAVRNLLRGAPVSDLDMAVDLPPEAVLKALRKAGLKAIATGLAHGTVTALTGERRYEITSLRQDVATDGRHAVVAYGQDWAVDAARRDFTMNALYLDRDGALFDPVGGRADAEAGRVRFIGAPATRLAEDILRLLRFYRLHAAFGAGPPDPAGRAACRAAAGDLPRLSGERVADEMIKLLAAPAAATALAAMAEDEIWPHLGLGPVDPARAGRVI